MMDENLMRAEIRTLEHVNAELREQLHRLQHALHDAEQGQAMVNGIASGERAAREKAQTEVRRLRAALTEIRDMHRTVDDDPGGPPYCPECDADSYPDPCRTFATARTALDGGAGVMTIERTLDGALEAVRVLEEYDKATWVESLLAAEVRRLRAENGQLRAHECVIPMQFRAERGEA